MENIAATLRVMYCYIYSRSELLPFSLALYIIKCLIQLYSVLCEFFTLYFAYVQLSHFDQ